MKLEIIDTRSNTIVSTYRYDGRTASDEASVFIAFLDYWERYYEHQSRYAWRSVDGATCAEVREAA